MIAKLAYLTTPGPNRYVLNFQLFGSDDLLSFEIGQEHLANILSDGVSLALRTQLNRVPITPAGEKEHERTSTG